MVLVRAINGGLDLERAPFDGEEGDVASSSTEIDDQHITLTRGLRPCPYSILSLPLQDHAPLLCETRHLVSLTSGDLGLQRSSGQ